MDNIFFQKKLLTMGITYIIFVKDPLKIFIEIAVNGNYIITLMEMIYEGLMMSLKKFMVLIGNCS